MERVAFNISSIDLVCLTAIKGRNVDAVRQIIGAKRFAADDPQTFESGEPSSDAIISEWGDSILVSEPSYGKRCAQPETLAALAIAGCSVLTTCWWDRGISPMWPGWHNILALAADGRLLSALNPSDDLDQRIGWDPPALDAFIAGSRFDYEVIPVRSPTGQTRGRGAGGSITVAHWRDACISALERFAQAELHEGLVWSAAPERAFVLSDPLKASGVALPVFLGFDRRS